MNNFSWDTAIAVLAALSWVPWIFKTFDTPKLDGKILSHFQNQGVFRNINGTFHFLISIKQIKTAI